MLHEHPAEVAELQRDGHLPARAQSPYVLATLLPRRNVGRAAVARQRLALLEMDVDRMVPAAAAVAQRPDLAGAEARRRRDSAEVRGERAAVVSRDAPGSKERGHGVVGRLARAAIELEHALPRHR